MKDGDTYETYDYATCHECRKHFRKPILCEAVQVGVYHRRVRDLGPWARSPHAGTSYRVWLYCSDHEGLIGAPVEGPAGQLVMC